MILQIYKDNTTVNIFDSLQTDWTSINDITNWDKYSDFLLENQLINDYKVLRKIIETLVVAITGSDYSNFNLLTDVEKNIAAKYLVNRIPFATLMTIPNMTEEKLKEFGNDFNLNSIKARDKRLNKAKEKCFILFDRLSVLYLLNQITGVYEQVALDKRYIDGIESLADDGYIGLIDFILTISSITEINTINGVTKAQAQAILLDVIQNGVY
jgi:hypothetical protein